MNPPNRELDARADAPGATPFSRRLWAIVGVVAIAATTWRLSDLLVLLFAAVVLGIALRSMANHAQRLSHLPAAWFVLITVVTMIAALSVGGWALGDSLIDPFTLLQGRLPEAIRAATQWLQSHAPGRQVIELWQGASSENLPWARLAGLAGTTVVGLGNLALVLVLAIYLAAAPGLYRGGLVTPLRTVFRARAEMAFGAAAGGLRRWLPGQLVSMVFVGVTTGIGLRTSGIPLPLAVGVISGLLAFIPFFGAIAGGLLAVLLAFSEGPQAALYVAFLCVAIQQIEGNVLMPLVQRWAVGGGAAASSRHPGIRSVRETSTPRAPNDFHPPPSS